jgi:hypothetical protein
VRARQANIIKKELFFKVHLGPRMGACLPNIYTPREGKRLSRRGGFADEEEIAQRRFDGYDPWSSPGF